ACASMQTKRPPGVPQPDIDARLANSLFFGSTSESPATIEVRIVNRGKVPITAQRVEVDSPGMGQYTLQRYARDYHEVIPPGEEKTLVIFTQAVAQTTTRPTEPLTIRAIVEFEAAG